MKYDILVNKNNCLDESYNVENLVSVGQVYDTVLNDFSSEDILLEREAANALTEMLNDVNALFPKCKVIPDSGYRSSASQVEILNYYLEKEGEAAFERVAMPGASEHHTGLAIDIALLENGNYYDDVSGDEPAIAWIHENAKKYGFILRYPEGSSNVTGVRYEPWHLRYVGKELAKEITDRGILLEEYHEQKIL